MKDKDKVTKNPEVASYLKIHPGEIQDAFGRRRHFKDDLLNITCIDVHPTFQNFFDIYAQRSFDTAEIQEFLVKEESFSDIKSSHDLFEISGDDRTLKCQDDKETKEVLITMGHFVEGDRRFLDHVRFLEWEQQILLEGMDTCGSDDNRFLCQASWRLLHAQKPLRFLQKQNAMNLQGLSVGRVLLKENGELQWRIPESAENDLAGFFSGQFIPLQNNEKTSLKTITYNCDPEEAQAVLQAFDRSVSQYLSP